MDENKQRGFSGKIVSTILICVTFIWATTYYVSHMTKSTSLDTSVGEELVNTIEVNGEGRVFGRPDILKIQVGVSEIALTSKEAQAKLNVNIQKVLSALKANKVEEKDIQTVELSLMQEVEWNNNTKKILGQRATQRFMITIRGVQKDLEISGKVIDSITFINGVEIGAMQFDIEDKTELYRQGRELAFKKAKQKADDLAKVAGLSLSKPIRIQDQVQTPYYSPYSNQYLGKAMDSIESSSQIPSGQMEIVVQLNVVFGIQK
jgi:uncharacterized protein YggE